MSFFQKFFGKKELGEKESPEEIVMKRARLLVTVDDRTSQLTSMSKPALSTYYEQVSKNQLKICRLHDSLKQKEPLSPDEAMMYHASTKALNKLNNYMGNVSRELEKRGMIKALN